MSEYHDKVLVPYKSNWVEWYRPLYPIGNNADQVRYVPQDLACGGWNGLEGKFLHFLTRVSESQT
ncbi:hypothetical protein GCM10009096_04260 [Parasphingorhabdus litoris]|uniref:Uncharacterized protein n=1 Tax=Parasphingorhabdus litoris TaxID=394733 RepID=A0ABP3JZC3_9SPHN